MSNSLIKLFISSAEEYPAKVAISHNEESITYGELLFRITTLSNFLIEQSLQKGDHVSLLMDNSIDYVVAYYSVLFSGGTVIALNTAAKSKDLVNWIQHSDSKWLIADSEHPELPLIANNVNIKYILKGNYNEDVEKVIPWEAIFTKQYDHFPDVSIENDDLAAIIYTSGTTGQPKGVMLSHKNLHHNVSSILEYLELNSEDSILNVLPFYYSFGNSILHTHLAVGARIVLENNVAFPQKILKKIEKEKITGFSGVPSTFSLLMNRNKLSDFDFSNLRYMSQAGGPMAPANIQRLKEELPKVKFFVMYGQTEATARLAYLPPEQLQTKLGSIGKAIPGIRLEVQNQLGNKCLPYETGEICACGDSIMLGYWKAPDETCKVIRDGWLRTGDLAHYDDEDYIYIDGRSSDMIKSGAHRISPKEIEETILEIEEISEVVVIGIPNELLGQEIKAIVVLKKNAEINKNRILQHCKQNLAMYKIPKHVEFMNELPKTASGKVRKFMLQEEKV